MKVPTSIDALLLWIHLVPLTTHAFLSTRNIRGVSAAKHVSTTERFVLEEKLSSEEIHSRLESQLAKLREKDRTSKPISTEVRRFIDRQNSRVPSDSCVLTVANPS